MECAIRRVVPYPASQLGNGCILYAKDVIRTGKARISSYRRREILVSTTLGIAISFLIIATFTWVILDIHNDQSRLLRVTAKIVSVDGSEHSHLERTINFGKYSLTVRYRDTDGSEVTNWIEKTTWGVPSAGDSITLLVDPKSDKVKPNPFPELWIVLALVYAGFGWLIRFFITYSRRELKQAA
jgi:hypothetical protein